MLVICRHTPVRLHEVKNTPKFFCLSPLKLILYIGFEKPLLIFKTAQKPQICPKKCVFVSEGFICVRGQCLNDRFDRIAA
ncbi:hypothetical protein E4190_003285 [Brucella abortus]|nr:predicted protein [Brucella abortus bv. 6 str. 870]EEX80915.1 predicted protein [Brucella abortus bv. 9 str. C68]EFH35370.1 hypothetical protein BAYG_01821 [Brucella abortus bv. 5 str. B3196]TKC73959.1 hypothetical protein E4190_003285 [Brucella abortus]